MLKERIVAVVLAFSAMISLYGADVPGAQAQGDSVGQKQHTKKNKKGANLSPKALFPQDSVVVPPAGKDKGRSSRRRTKVSFSVGDLSSQGSDQAASKGAALHKKRAGHPLGSLPRSHKIGNLSSFMSEQPQEVDLAGSIIDQDGDVQMLDAGMLSAHKHSAGKSGGDPVLMGDPGSVVAAAGPSTAQEQPKSEAAALDPREAKRWACYWSDFFKELPLAENPQVSESDFTRLQKMLAACPAILSYGLLQNLAQTVVNRKSSLNMAPLIKAFYIVAEAEQKSMCSVQAVQQNYAKSFSRRFKAAEISIVGRAPLLLAALLKSGFLMSPEQAALLLTIVPSACVDGRQRQWTNTCMHSEELSQIVGLLRQFKPVMSAAQRVAQKLSCDCGGLSSGVFPASGVK